MCRLCRWLKQIIKVHRAYRGSHHSRPRLFRPVLYSEKVQWRKLFDVLPVYTTLSDKLAVRSFVAERGFSHLLIPLLWSGASAAEIPRGKLVPPFVLKSTHASSHVLIAREPVDIDWDEFSRQTRNWLAVCYGSAAVEPGYLAVPRRLMVEAYLASADAAPALEYKVFVFHGRTEFVMYIRVDAEQQRHTAFYRRNWERLDWGVAGQPTTASLPAPARLAELLSIAETLAAGFDHLRLDFYLRDEDIFIGEISLYPWSGLKGLYPRAGDAEMGRLWRIERPAWRAMKAIFTTRWGTAD